MNDVRELQRFVEAQQAIYQTVLDELKRGRKSGHWMWYIFPQIRGLAHSATSDKYTIRSLEEAASYAGHPILGPRLRECTQFVLNVNGLPIEHIFAYPDNLKFRSCMTLFCHAVPDKDIFESALLKYFGGEPDQRTLKLLSDN